jgi:hypothetical protein
MPTSRASVSIGTTRPQVIVPLHVSPLLTRGIDPARRRTDPERPLLQAEHRQEQDGIGVAAGVTSNGRLTVLFQPAVA